MSQELGGAKRGTSRFSVRCRIRLPRCPQAPVPSLFLVSDSLSEVVLRNRIHIGSKNTGWSLH